MKTFIDNTMMNSFKACPRKFFYRHKRQWTRDYGPSMPLAFGLAWHEAMDALWLGIYKYTSRSETLDIAFGEFMRSWCEAGLPALDDLTVDDVNRMGARHPMTAKDMLAHYYDQRRSWITQLELVAVEAPFVVNVGIDDVYYIGRRDKLFKYGGEYWVGEHKTSTDYSINYGFQPSFVDKWGMDSQCDGYIHALHMEYGSSAGGVMVDAALVHKKERRFKFIPVTKQPHAVAEWLEDLQAYVDDMARYEDNHLWPRRSTECVSVYGKCPFYDLCMMTKDPYAGEDKQPPHGYKYDPWSPIEVNKLETLLS